VSKSFVVRVLAAWLVFASFATHAAGLGDLRVLSALGEPLRAEIDIVELTSAERDSLNVRIASSEAFRKAGIEFNPALIGVKLSIQRRDGKPVILVTTKDRVNEPFLEMLVELEWASGRLVRDYTVLLDPPTYIPPPPAGAVMGPTTPAPAVAQPTPPSPPVAPSAEAPAVTGGVEYEVVKGDTLSKIAREYQYSGVTFNQMMIAIYRANKEAFIRDNINLVRAGRILRVPDRDAVAAVNPEEARDTVLAHMASFAEYRRAIAASAPTAPAGEGTRTAEGQISAPGGAAKPEGAQDQLKLSRAEPGAPGSAAAAAASADDRAARDRELKEAQSRVEELEKNVTDLQKLLEIKNQQVAELEKRAVEAGAAPAPKPAAEAPKPAAESPKPAAEAPKPAAESPKPAAQAPKPAAEAPKPAPKPVPKPRPAPPPPAPSLVDEYLGDPIMVGGLGVVILLLIGYGWYAWKKKKRVAQTQLGDSLLGVAAGGAAAGGAAAGAAGATADEVDPIAEADVYLAYGRDTQAEEILREAMQKDASRPAIHGKMLEIFARRRDPKSFEETALKLKALVNGEGPEWDKAMALGRSIDAGNKLYGEGEAAPVAPGIDVTGTPAVDFNIEATTTGIDRRGSDVTVDFDLGGATSEERPVAVPSEGEDRPKVDTTGPLDFDLGTSTASMDKTVAPEEAPAQAAPATGGGLDFELNLDAGPEASTEQEGPAGGDLSGISLDLGGGESPGGGGDAKWQEVATKLDLAKAYEEMGDKDGARELLNEVAREGDASQQAQAQQMLASLG
jgi:pilus assembly protein FimV